MFQQLLVTNYIDTSVETQMSLGQAGTCICNDVGLLKLNSSLSHESSIVFKFNPKFYRNKKTSMSLRTRVCANALVGKIKLSTTSSSQEKNRRQRRGRKNLKIMSLHVLKNHLEPSFVSTFSTIPLDGKQCFVSNLVENIGFLPTNSVMNLYDDKSFIFVDDTGGSLAYSSTGEIIFIKIPREDSVGSVGKYAFSMLVYWRLWCHCQGRSTHRAAR